MAVVLRLGVAGIGIAFTQVYPHLKEIADKVRLTAVADIRREALESFKAKNRDVEIFESVEQMCASPQVDAVWVATPNALHAEHSIMAAEHGKHVICEKPMGITLEQCDAMIRAAEKNRVKFVQGHSKIYDAPVKKMREIVLSGQLGRVIQINTWNFNDWLLRALTPSEVDTDLGSGVVFRQGPHQVDTVRFLGGGLVRSVRAVAGRWAPNFPGCEGDYTALLEFESKAAATMVFNGYGYFDITELTWEIGEGGRKMLNSDSLLKRPHPTGPIEPVKKYALVEAGNPYGYSSNGGPDMTAPRKQPFFGLTVVSCERGVIRQSPEGLYVYGAEGREEVPCPPSLGRAAELLELHEAVTEDREPFLDANWGKATVEVILAILQSSKERREVLLEHQVPCREITGW